MDVLTLILIFLILFGIFLFIIGNKKNIKPPAVKKDELIEDYKNQMRVLLVRYKKDKHLQTQEKIKLLKQINQDLSMNLFFEKEEATKLLKELSTLE